MKNKHKIWNRIILSFVLLSLLVMGLVSPSQAADFRSDEVVVIEAGEVIDDDLFVSGNRVEVNGTVKGDLFASATEVTVNGVVEGSLFVAGQTLRVNGTVDGSLYGGGYSLIVGPDTEIGRNLYFGGFSLETEAGSTVGRGLYAGNYQSILGGQVAHDVATAGGALELNGSVGGDVNAEVTRPEDATTPTSPYFPGAVTAIEPGFRQGPNAEVGGSLDVRESVSSSISAAEERGPLGLSRPVSQRVGEFIALLIVGGLMLYFGPELTRRASHSAQTQPLPSLGWGGLLLLIFVIGVPILAIMIVLLALLGGLVTFGQLFGTILTLGMTSLALIVTGFIFILALVTKAIIVYLGGQMVLDRLAPQLEAGFSASFAALATGAVIYELLRAIPLGLGWLIGIIVTLVGLGAIYLIFRKEPSTAPTETVTPTEAVA